VVGLAKLLGGGSNGSSGNDAARNVADTSTTTSTGSTGGATALDSPSYGPTGGPTGATGQQRHQQATVSASPVVMPSGPCSASDVAITPSVPQPIAGRDISLVLDISSLETPACTWTMSARTMALKITSGQDLIWTSMQCGRDIPKQDLVLRQSSPTRVTLTWDAQRSQPGCPVHSLWALPGTYHLHVAALAGAPQSVTFMLAAPTPAQVTRTAHPHNRHRKHHH
jgi:hypothetical protein